MYPRSLSPDFDALNPDFPHTNNPHIIHNAITTAMMIPDSLNMATLFPAAAIRPNRPAEPLRDVLIEEKVSDYKSVRPNPASPPFRHISPASHNAQTYRVVNDILRPCIVVDVHCNAAQGSDFGRELRQARVVLALALICVRHGEWVFIRRGGESMRDSGR